jgi:U3 small nucleolar ribonucleoprotein component
MEKWQKTETPRDQKTDVRREAERKRKEEARKKQEEIRKKREDPCGFVVILLSAGCVTYACGT